MTGGGAASRVCRMAEDEQNARLGYEPRPIDLDAVPAFLSGDESLRLAIIALGIVLLMAAVLAWFYYVLHY